jgi:hypothetical protein
MANSGYNPAGKDSYRPTGVTDTHGLYYKTGGTQTVTDKTGAYYETTPTTYKWEKDG